MRALEHVDSSQGVRGMTYVKHGVGWVGKLQPELAINNGASLARDFAAATPFRGEFISRVLPPHCQHRRA